MYWLGLLHADLTEPNADTGYARVSVDKDSMAEPVIFEEVTKDCGLISFVAVYSSQDAKKPLKLIKLSHSESLVAGVIPIFKDRRLLLGVDVSAQIVTAMQDAVQI